MGPFSLSSLQMTTPRGERILSPWSSPVTPAPSVRKSTKKRGGGGGGTKSPCSSRTSRRLQWSTTDVQGRALADPIVAALPVGNEKDNMESDHSSPTAPSHDEADLAADGWILRETSEERDMWEGLLTKFASPTGASWAALTELRTRMADSRECLRLMRYSTLRLSRENSQCKQQVSALQAVSEHVRSASSDCMSLLEFASLTSAKLSSGLTIEDRRECEQLLQSVLQDLQVGVKTLSTVILQASQTSMTADMWEVWNKAREQQEQRQNAALEQLQQQWSQERSTLEKERDHYKKVAMAAQNSYEQLQRTVMMEKEQEKAKKVEKERGRVLSPLPVTRNGRILQESENENENTANAHLIVPDGKSVQHSHSVQQCSSREANANDRRRMTKSSLPTSFGDGSMGGGKLAFAQVGDKENRKVMRQDGLDPLAGYLFD
jgi:hypothetical protein